MQGSLKRILLFGAAAVIFLSGSTAVRADEDETTKNANFSVVAVLPDNQRNDIKSYFNLLTEPGKEQTLEIEINNPSSEKKVLEVGIATATTARPGTVNYSLDAEKPDDDTLKYKMEDIVTTESRVELEAGAQYTLRMQVKVPAEPFEGVLAGGITFTEEGQEEEEEEESTADGIGIKNTFSHCIAILMRENENQITPELILNDVKADNVNGLNAVSANFQNIQPSFILDMKVDSWVTQRDESEKIYEYKEDLLEMAPNSNYDSLISLNGEPFAAGDYTFTAEVEGSGEKWILTKDFTITPEEAKELNAADMSLEQDNTLLFIVIGAGVLLLLVIIILVVRSKKKKKRMQMIMRQRQMKQRQQRQPQTRGRNQEKYR